VDREKVKALLEEVARGTLSPERALARLRDLPVEDLGFARVDHHRAIRRGFPEVILGEGKQPADVALLAERLAAGAGRVLVTRASRAVWDEVHRALPEAEYNATARTIVVRREPAASPHAGVLVLSAGTADAPVAEEAAITAEIMDCAVERVYDVGVAGLHRLLDQWERLKRARVIVVVAGMEGALPSVVSGLVRVPVIGVPTSVGYGASFGGLAALLAMLNSCSAGVGVVNIDNGFAAGYLAALIARSGGD